MTANGPRRRFNSGEQDKANFLDTFSLTLKRRKVSEAHTARQESRRLVRARIRLRTAYLKHPAMGSVTTRISRLQVKFLFVP